MTGEGEGKEGNACPQTPPTNAASDWCGAGIVGYLALETSIKPGMLCLRAPQIDLVLSDLCSQITIALD